MGIDCIEEQRHVVAAISQIKQVCSLFAKESGITIYMDSRRFFIIYIEVRKTFSWLFLFFQVVVKGRWQLRPWMCNMTNEVIIYDRE